MVILDTTNKLYGNNTNILYLSLIDIDYIVKKYGLDVLKKQLPKEYAEGFELVLEYVNGEDELSSEYYSLEHIAISEDEYELLDIICNEISKGNMFTRDQLFKLEKENLNSKISELETIRKEHDLTPEELYKLRTYQLVEYVENARKKAKESYDNIFDDGTKGFLNGSMEGRKKKYEIYYEKYMDILQRIGLKSFITESDYFKEYIPLSR